MTKLKASLTYKEINEENYYKDRFKRVKLKLLCFIILVLRLYFVVQSSINLIPKSTKMEKNPIES